MNTMPFELCDPQLVVGAVDRQVLCQAVGRLAVHAEGEEIRVPDLCLFSTHPPASKLCASHEHDQNATEANLDCPNQESGGRFRIDHLMENLSRDRTTDSADILGKLHMQDVQDDD